MPSLLLSNPLGSDDAQEIGLEPREFRVGEVITVDDYVFATLIRTGYGIPYGTTTDILLIGNGSPNASLGVDGQWYLDRLAEVLWGPKVGGYWPSNPIRPDRGVQQLALGGDGHLRVTYSTGAVVDLGYVVGPAGATGATYTHRGSWAAGTAYAVRDVVRYNGSTYLVTTAHTPTAGQTPDVTTSSYALWASKGDQGIQGVQGVQGVQGAAGPGFVARGAWASGIVYAVNDIVTTGGATYRSKTAHTSGATFTGAGTNWELWAAAGVMTDATTTAKGAILLAGDLTGTADAPTVTGKGVAGGFATLGDDGKVPLGQLPATASGSSDVGTVAVDGADGTVPFAVNISGRWGITDAGAVYYDSNGAVPAEAGLLVPDPDGNGFSVFRPGGPWTSEDQRVANFIGQAAGPGVAASATRTALDTRDTANAAANDSGWVPIAINNGFAQQGATVVAVRKKNGVLYFRGGFTSAGMAINGTYSVGLIPVGFRPVDWWYGSPGMSSGAFSASLVVQSDGQVIIKTGSALSSYYLIDPVVRLAD